MFCDNQEAISIVKSPAHHDRTKHVGIDRHFIRDNVEDETINLICTPTILQIANILTKELPRTNFKWLNKQDVCD